MRFQSYKDLEIYQRAHTLAIEIHRLSLTFPQYEIFEEGSQIRRSAKSISSNIIEGFGRRRYKNEFVKFLTYALASCDETREHLDLVFDTGQITDKQIYEYLSQEYDILGRKINNFLKSVEKEHMNGSRVFQSHSFSASQKAV